MSAKPAVLREAAVRDLRGAVDFYVGEGSTAAALSFIDALEGSLQDLRAHPLAGSPRYAVDLDIPGLRSWIVPGFPYLIFYRDGPEHIDVWRVLHAERDVPEYLR